MWRDGANRPTRGWPSALILWANANTSSPAAWVVLKFCLVLRDKNQRVLNQSQTALNETRTASSSAFKTAALSSTGSFGVYSSRDATVSATTLGCSDGL